jgi:N6-adenosine-specific RNA methylase IME4
MTPLPTPPRGGFAVIYADPPWKYGNARTRSAAAKEYPVMKIADLRALPVGDIAAPSSTLHLWTTAPFMRDALDLGESWGFKYKTIGFLWAKRNTKANTPFFGMGNYSRANVEPCLLFTRGRPVVKDRGVPQFLWSPKLRHSEKPDEIRKRIVRLFGDVPRLELFSRHVVPGWERWGNEVLA